MKITIPHMGYTYIALEALLQEMGHEVIVPPKCSKRTLTLGTKYSPETVCLPLKVNIGNFLEAIELGAEAILMAGGVGPCRFGYYAEVQRAILEDLGKEAEIIVLEPPQENFRQLTSGIRRLFAPRGFASFIHGCKLAWEKLQACEELTFAAHYARPRQRDKEQITNILRLALDRIRKAALIKDIRQVKESELAKIREVANDDKLCLRVGIVGEVYTVIEPFVNLELEERLGNLGMEVHRTISLVDWVKDHLILSSLGLYSNRELVRQAKGYLRGFVGGHGLESVAHSIELAKQGYDGVVHILPFTCMPEIVAQSILPQVSHDHEIPILTLVVDEHTGAAGFQTRLEAFVDLLHRKKEEVKHETTASLLGS